jgi:hypothetical protein
MTVQRIDLMEMQDAVTKTAIPLAIGNSSAAVSNVNPSPWPMVRCIILFTSVL